MATAGATRGAGPERAYHRPLPAAGVVRLSADESRHLVRVRRVAVGDEVVLFDGAGGTRAGRLVAAGRDGADVEIVGSSPDREPSREVVVATAWPEGARADDLVATLAELGVARLVPLFTARAQADVAARVDRRRDRYVRLAVEAAKVNGRSRLLDVGAPAPLAAVLVARGDAVAVLLDTDPSLPALSTVLGGARRVVLVVGPEGGFTPAEVEEAARAGVVRASLGACALRTETACLAAAAIALSAPPA
jgi:16S rRNA (uracil1498-N3)-methyltransferase